MNVGIIERLSNQHKLLKSFHEACNHNDVILVAKKTAHSYGDVELNHVTTKSIICEIRCILLERINEVEKSIKEAATKI